MTKLIILVLLYIIQGVKIIFNFLASADINVFGRTYPFAYNAASDWPPPFYIYPGCFQGSRMVVNREAKKKQAVHDERVSYLHVAPL